MSDVKETVEQKKPVVVEYEKPKFASMTDAEIMEEMVSRNMELPLDNNKLVRNAAIKMLNKYEEEKKPLSAYRKMRVIFHRSGKEAEAPYVFLGLNGYACQAPYEIEVVVPEPVIRGCVDNATMTEYVMGDFDPTTGQTKYIEKIIRAVPYTFLGYED